METLEYAPERRVDVYGGPSDPPVLVWHGTQTDARATVARLAESLRTRGFAVLAADWDSHADDGGRADLLRSVDFVGSWSAHPDQLILVGWSLGGVAAAGYTIRAERFGLVPAHTVCLAGAFMVVDPISGERLSDALRTAPVGAPFTLLHGRSDDVVPVTASREFAAQLEAVGWPVTVVELDTDHGAIAGARYEAAADRYVPAEDAATRRVADDVAARIAATR